MILSGPYSFSLATDLSNNYKHLIGKYLNIGAIAIGRISAVHVSPYEESDMISFTERYSCDLNINMEEVFYQEYETELCDVVIFLCPTNANPLSGVGYQRLSEFLEKHMSSIS